MYSTRAKIVVGILLLNSLIIILCKYYTFEKKIEIDTTPSFAYYVEGEKTTEIPKKESGYTLSKTSSCNNGVTISWDDEAYSAIVDYANFNLTSKERTSCNLYFEEKPALLRNLGESNYKGIWGYKGGDCKVLKFIIQNKIEPIEEAIAYDESANQDGSIMGYVLQVDEASNGMPYYHIYLQSNRKILLNEDSSYMFANFFAIESIEGIEYLDTSKVKNMSAMFSNLISLTSLDVTNFDTRNVTDMREMFEGMSDLTSLDLSNFDTSNVTDMNKMFSGMSSLTSLDLRYFDTSNVTDMSYMFSGMSSLTSLDLSVFDTSNVTNMIGMFYEMISLTSLGLSNFDTSKVTDMRNMFMMCKGLTSLDLSSFDTRNVWGFQGMFCSSNNLTNIVYGENFIYNGGITSSMYSGCLANKPSHESWNNVNYT